MKRVWPPGYHFVPFDLELLDVYLAAKLDEKPLPPDVPIYNDDVYRTEPWNLPHCRQHGIESTGYYFTKRSSRYTNGNRARRTAGIGTWKASGSTKEISRENGEVAGHKAAFAFYTDEDRSKSTGWVMQEYLRGPPKKDAAGSSNFEDWALYQIRLNPAAQKKLRAGKDIITCTAQETSSSGPVESITQCASVPELPGEPKLINEEGAAILSSQGETSLVTDDQDWMILLNADGEYELALPPWDDCQAEEKGQGQIIEQEPFLSVSDQPAIGEPEDPPMTVLAHNFLSSPQGPRHETDLILSEEDEVTPSSQREISLGMDCQSQLNSLNAFLFADDENE